MLKDGLSDKLIIEWIEALKSGSVLQCFDLYRVDEYYSPIGLLAHMMQADLYDAVERMVNERFSKLNLKKLVTEYGLKTSPKSFSDLIERLNDESKLSLKKIGSIIETQFINL